MSETYKILKTPSDGAKTVVATGIAYSLLDEDQHRLLQKPYFHTNGHSSDKYQEVDGSHLQRNG
jgi:hypothetical protein